MAFHMSEFLTSHSLSCEDDVDASANLVDLIASHPEILQVSQLAGKTGRSVRSLEPLFDRYVGVSPKWVIRRFCLHELVECLHSEKPFASADVASDLGYADQAHMIRDFRDIAGFTPTEYRAAALNHKSS